MLGFKYPGKVGPSWSWSYGSLIYNYICSLCLNFFHLLARKPNLEKCSIQTNSFIFFTCPNPVLLVPGFGSSNPAQARCTWYNIMW